MTLTLAWRRSCVDPLEARRRLCKKWIMRLVQVAQHAEDLQRAADFYRRLTDSEPTGLFDPPGLLFFDLAGVRLLLDRRAPSSLIYLHVVNIHAAIERLGGVEVIEQPHVIFRHDNAGALGPAGHEEWQAFIRDSEGNSVGLVSFQRP
jgi:methylmalonyl-CoA/ethylmalonyl-CoA epimerase